MLVWCSGWLLGQWLLLLLRLGLLLVALLLWLGELGNYCLHSGLFYF